MSKNNAKLALKFAQERSGEIGSWIELHNAVFGIGGKCSELFPSESERVAFSQTDEFRRIIRLIEETRTRCGDQPEGLADLLSAANGNISLRLPRAVHAALLAEAKAEGVSLNQLCLAKLAVQLRAVV